MFYFSTITADGCMGACTGPVFATNTIPSAPGKERGEKRFSKRGCLVGGPAVAGLDPLLFLSCRSGGRRRRRVQRPGASERGGVWLSVNALASANSWQAEWRKRQVQASRAAESAQSWGDSEQLLIWSAWAGSVA